MNKHAMIAHTVFADCLENQLESATQSICDYLCAVEKEYSEQESKYYYIHFDEIYRELHDIEKRIHEYKSAANRLIRMKNNVDNRSQANVV
jgi:hypothetical protein